MPYKCTTLTNSRLLGFRYSRSAGTVCHTTQALDVFRMLLKSGRYAMHVCGDSPQGA